MSALGGARLLRVFARNDARLVLRDSMLATLLVMVLGIALVARWVLPYLDAALAASGVLPSETNPTRLRDVFPLLVSFIGLWEAALLPGVVVGFLLLDEKEDQTMVAVRVAPVPFTRFLRYRVTLAAGLAFGFALAVPSLMGHAQLDWAHHVPIALGAALAAPWSALLLAGFAADKVQGLAFTKFGGVAGLTILIGWFVPEPWQWLLGVFPPFLVCKSYWMALSDEPLWFVPLLVGAAAQLPLITYLLRAFPRLAR